ncbi:hypothetical protein SKAU_G00169550 [Synaphobranchus kaupii]|uniref:Ig-like domain-containing protein n=1 Tax=Synaphobranchus kaupii TaxID=118154 RepID=A0A9Q1FK43_SYNKA|nr:hypothetical protein SKAU_G00169550 [Synaphobranchus kaupii]
MNSTQSSSVKELTIPALDQSHGGRYSCRGQIPGRAVYTEISNDVTLAVDALPLAVLTTRPAWRNFYATEKVTLTCEIQNRHTGWTYLWYRDGASMNSAQSSSVKELTIPALDQSHGGRYFCRGQIPRRAVYTEISNDVTLAVDALPHVVLTLQTRWTDIFNTERATLQCEIQDRSPVWMYKWYRDGQELPVGTAKDTYKILSAVQSDSGIYTCKGQHKDRALDTGSSNTIPLNVFAPPPAALTLNPAWRNFYVTEKVTLTCEIQNRQTGWTYLWYRDGASMNRVQSSSVKELTIPALDQSHGGRYSCRGQIPGRAVYTEISNDVTLAVDAPPLAVLTTRPAWRNFYTTEKVTLTCEIQNRHTGWTYLWYRDGASMNSAQSSSGKELTIPALDQSHGGRYSCSGQISGRAVYTEISNDVTLAVDALPLAVLTTRPAWRNFYATEKVTLTCEIQNRHTGWTYLWYRDGASMNSAQSSSGKELTIPALDQSHGGRYSCRGQIPGRAVYTEISNDVTLAVDALPHVVLTLQTRWTNIFDTERATLHCEIQDRSPVWMYKWYREGQELPVGTAKDTYSILSAGQSDSGTYTCKGQHKDRALYTGSSNTIPLNVFAPPPAALTLNPAWRNFYVTEKVTLTCEIQNRQTGWTYLWYRDEASMNSTQSSSVKELTIPALDQSHGGRYSCRGQIPGRAVYTEISNDVTLAVDENTPNPLLTQDPPSGEIFTGDRVNLSCGCGTDSASWKYFWYKGKQGALLSTPVDSSSNGSSYTISAASVSHSGQYWCRAGRGTPSFYTLYSHSLKLNITARPQAVLTLETAWTEVFRTDSLTLRCEVEGSSLEWNYTWYRDGQHLPLHPSRDRLTLTSGNDTYHSEYRCRGNRTGKPSYTEISDGFREANIVLKRKVLVSVVSTILLGLILITLGCLCLRKKRKLAYKPPPQNDLFFSKQTTEKLNWDSEHSSDVDQSTETKGLAILASVSLLFTAACSIELYSIVDLQKNIEVLPPKKDPEELTTFKACQ